MAVTSRLQGVSGGLAIKAPVLVASTGNLTLSATQVVDGIAVSSCDRVLAKDQTTEKENGIYIVETAAWTRAKDFDGSLDVVRGTVVFVSTGAATGGRWYGVSSTGDNIPGSNPITFAEVSFPASLTAVLNTNGFAINESEGAAVVQSTITDIWSPTGNTVHVTSSTAIIESLSTAPRIGALRNVIFDSTGILTHDSSILILPSSADIEYLDGDVAVIYGDSTSKIRMMGFLPADARDYSVPESTLIPGDQMRNSGMTLISSDSTSDTATSIQLSAPVKGSHKEIFVLASATALVIESTLTGHVFLTGATAAAVGTSAILLHSDNLFGTALTLRGLSSTQWALIGHSTVIVSS